MESGAASATVTVQDNDTAPVVTTASPVAAPENGVAIATLQANDDDTPENRIRLLLNAWRGCNTLAFPERKKSKDNQRAVLDYPRLFTTIDRKEI